MKHLISSIISGSVILAIGLVLGGSLFSGRIPVVSADEGPLVDGQPQQPTAETPKLEQTAAEANLLATAAEYTWTYAAHEFQPTHSNLTFASFGPARYALNIPSGGYSFMMPVSLPDGSQVTSIKFYVVDNSSTDNMSLLFYRINLTNSTQSELGSISTSGLPTSSAVQSVEITGTPITTIDKTDYAYALRYQPVIAGNLHMLVGAQIKFIPPPGYNFLPLINR